MGRDTGIVTIGASDGLATGAPAVSAGPDAVVSEGDGWIDLPVTLFAPGIGPVSVFYTTANAGAFGGSACNADYVGDSGTLTFLPGETTKVVRIQSSTAPTSKASRPSPSTSPRPQAAPRSPAPAPCPDRRQRHRRRHARSWSCETRPSTRQAGRALVSVLLGGPAASSKASSPSTTRRRTVPRPRAPITRP